MNWKQNLADYIKRPLFTSYGNFQEKRRVLVDCSFGVNPLGASGGLFPRSQVCVDAVDYSMYPADGAHGNRALAEYVISRFPSLKPDELCFNAGSYAAISSLGRVLGGAKSRIQGFIPQFIPALMEFATAGAQVRTIRLDVAGTAGAGQSNCPDFGSGAVRAERLLESLQAGTSLLYLDNPNNPTGSVMPLAELRRLAEGCAERGVLLLVDEAYADFVDDGNSAFNLQAENVICVRSFSKGCGLAGFRIGYISIRDRELMERYQEVALQFGISALAGNVAAKLLPGLDLPAMRAQVRDLKKQTLDLILQTPGFQVAPTHDFTPIFLLGRDRGSSLYDALMEVGIQTEPGGFFDLGDNFVRLRIPGAENFELFRRQWLKAFE